VNLEIYLDAIVKGQLIFHHHSHAGVQGDVLREESTPRYTQQEVSLLSIPLSCLAIRLDIGLIQGLIDDSLRSFPQVPNDI